MKILLLFTASVVLALTTCAQRSKAMQDQQAAYNKLKSVGAGDMAASPGGWTMTATINGKPWSAAYLDLPKETARITGHNGEKGRAFLALPYNRRNIVAGKEIIFKETNATDISVPETNQYEVWSGYEGEMAITKVGDGWAEGTFHFKASDSGSAKSVEVTNGFFRIKTE